MQATNLVPRQAAVGHHVNDVRHTLVSVLILLVLRQREALLDCGDMPGALAHQVHHGAQRGQVRAQKLRFPQRAGTAAQQGGLGQCFLPQARNPRDLANLLYVLKQLFGWGVANTMAGGKKVQTPVSSKRSPSTRALGSLTVF